MDFRPLLGLFSGPSSSRTSHFVSSTPHAVTDKEVSTWLPVPVSNWSSMYYVRNVVTCSYNLEDV